MGIQEEDLVDPASVSDTFKCPVCMEIFDDPVFCGGWPCQHVFCRGCVTHALEQNPQCPTCRAEMDEEDLQPHQALRSLLDELQIRCRRGCGWQGRRDALPAHLALCPLELLDAARADLLARSERVDTLESELLSLRAALADAPRERRILELDARIAALEARAAEQDSSLGALQLQLRSREARVKELEGQLVEQGAADAALAAVRAHCAMAAAEATSTSNSPVSSSPRINASGSPIVSRASPTAATSARAKAFAAAAELAVAMASDDEVDDDSDGWEPELTHRSSVAGQPLLNHMTSLEDMIAGGDLDI